MTPERYTVVLTLIVETNDQSKQAAAVAMAEAARALTGKTKGGHHVFVLMAVNDTRGE